MLVFVIPHSIVSVRLIEPGTLDIVRIELGPVLGACCSRFTAHEAQLLIAHAEDVIAAIAQLHASPAALVRTDLEVFPTYQAVKRRCIALREIGTLAGVGNTLVYLAALQACRDLADRTRGWCRFDCRTLCDFATHEPAAVGASRQ